MIKSPSETLGEHIDVFSYFNALLGDLWLLETEEVAGHVLSLPGKYLSESYTLSVGRWISLEIEERSHVTYPLHLSLLSA